MKLAIFLVVCFFISALIASCLKISWEGAPLIIFFIIIGLCIVISFWPNLTSKIAIRKQQKEKKKLEKLEIKRRECSLKKEKTKNIEFAIRALLKQQELVLSVYDEVCAEDFDTLKVKDHINQRLVRK